MEELIKKIPSWARWILVPFSSYAGMRLASFLGATIIEVLLRLTGGSISWGAMSFMEHSRSLVTSFIIIYSGALLAPSHKVMTGLVIAGMLTLSSFPTHTRHTEYFLGGLWFGVSFIAIQSRCRQSRKPSLG